MTRQTVLPALIGAALVSSVSLAAPPKAPTAAPAAVPAPAAPAAPELEERIIEKHDADYVLRLTLRPGNVKTNHVAQGDVEIIRTLQIPDPVTGDQMPITGIQPVATVKPPEPPPGKGPKKELPTVSYLLWPTANPGVYAFHFTATEDGIYEISIAGSEAPKLGEEETDSRSFSATYRIGVGLAAAQTEQSQGGTAVRRSTRRPIGSDASVEKGKKLVKLMREVSDHFLALDASGPGMQSPADAAAEARAISALLAQARGLAPDQSGGDADEFARLATRAAASFDEYATAASTKGIKVRPALDPVESVGCNQCHAKYRFQITNDLSSWPKFAQKAVGQ